MLLPVALPAHAVPGVLVFHEAWGLTEHIVGIARWLAAQGFAALACDMYGGGLVTDDMAIAGGLITALRADPMVMRHRARAAFAALAADSRIDSSRIGALGFCFGGSTALELARSGAGLNAAICVHGTLSSALPGGGAVAAPILVCTGSADPIVPIAQLGAFADEMDAASVTWRAIVFGGSRHSFTNPLSASAGVPGAAYDPAADRETRAAILAFLRAPPATIRSPGC